MTDDRIRKPPSWEHYEKCTTCNAVTGEACVAIKNIMKTRMKRPHTGRFMLSAAKRLRRKDANSEREEPLLCYDCNSPIDGYSYNFFIRSSKNKKPELVHKHCPI